MQTTDVDHTVDSCGSTRDASSLATPKGDTESLAWGHQTLMPGRPETFFVYKGVRHTSLDKLLEVVGQYTPHAVPVSVSVDVLRSTVRDLYRQYSEARTGLKVHEFKGLAISLAAELGMDPLKFDSFSIIFYRFDIDGNGLVDENECVMVAESMLRHYREATTPLFPSGKVSMIDLDFKNIEDHYELSEKLGAGGMGAVYLARERSTGQQRVVKFYDKKSANVPVDEIREEFGLLKSLDHPRIQRLFDIFEDRSNVYVVSEPYLGGDLTDLVEKAMDNGVYVTAGWLTKIMYQVLLGVGYLHSRYIMHCDLKESNIMIASADDWREPAVKVIDFDLARNFVVQGSAGGTAGYMPPEVWTHGLWTAKGDVFALGVIIYQLFSHGTRCFDGIGDDAVMKATLEDSPNLEKITDAWRRCADLKPLVEQMLRKDFRERPIVKDCLEHTFFTSRVKKEDDDDEDSRISDEFIASLGAMRQRTNLQRAILADIAARVNLAELRELNDVFSSMDVDNDGTLTADEVRRSLGAHMDAEGVEQAVSKLVGPDGRVSYTTFMGQLLASQAAEENRLLWREFTELDSDGTGFLTRSEIAELLKRPALAQVMGCRSVSDLMALMDANGDDQVSFEEFTRAICREEAKIQETKGMPTEGFEVDQQLEYKSPSFGSWISCRVISRNVSGSVQIDCKPGYWMKRQEQARKLRLPALGEE
eukprot:gnl/TRDRNA2_/TRDRNA2_82401_c0_seq2.p1 gnl/TRDRNA2_/TRDRNA2_82401_c0~~gnl/TRDRNA2_/TRDRNA2_82401_c0_seq2.p1  ORF type:complete len:704 (+),score=134.79 gnl/TRDRNA2_/TRDRNA2_82401_c0_seq2:211-2322(+)